MLRAIEHPDLQRSRRFASPAQAKRRWNCSEPTFQRAHRVSGPSRHDRRPAGAAASSRNSLRLLRPLQRLLEPTQVTQSDGKVRQRARPVGAVGVRLASRQLAENLLRLRRPLQRLLEPTEVAQSDGEVRQRLRPVGAVGVRLASRQLAENLLRLRRPLQPLLEPTQVAQADGEVRQRAAQSARWASGWRAASSRKILLRLRRPLQRLLEPTEIAQSAARFAATSPSRRGGRPVGEPPARGKSPPPAPPSPAPPRTDRGRSIGWRGSPATSPSRRGGRPVGAPPARRISPPLAPPSPAPHRSGRLAPGRQRDCSLRWPSVRALLVPLLSPGYEPAGMLVDSVAPILRSDRTSKADRLAHHARQIAASTALDPPELSIIDNDNVLLSDVDCEILEIQAIPSERSARVHPSPSGSRIEIVVLRMWTEHPSRL